MNPSPPMPRLGLLLCATLLLACGKPPSPPVVDAGRTLPATTCLDNDGDGIPGTGDCQQESRIDCDDTDPGTYPGAPELCDGKDNNCDAVADEAVVYRDFFPDGDGDGYGQKGGPSERGCGMVMPGKVANQTDCDDANPAVNPGASEVCNAKDDNCDGNPDEGLARTDYYPDFDQDGFGSSSATAVSSCEPLAGKVSDHTDCNDGNPVVRPGATEVCNAQDDNCDGQVDEQNPGGGVSCATGQAGVCASGTVTCQAGTLNCLRTVSPSAELCDGVDNDCDNQTDEDFPNKGQPCSSGLGVCLRAGSYSCKPDLSGTACSATAGASTAAACDGLDNDCDGVVDEPYLAATSNLGATAYQDLEFSPWYYSASGCAGGQNGGSDALAGGAVAMGKGPSGLYLQRLDAAGAVLGAPSEVSSLTYADVGIAQAGDAYLIAAIYALGAEIDLYLVDAATGTKRAYTWSLFNPGSGNSIDSLRVVRGNGRRVVLVWREVVTGATPSTRIRMARAEPFFDGTSWSIRNPGGAPGALTSVEAFSGAVLPGLGADSTHDDTGALQPCQPSSSLRNLSVAYLASPQSLKAFGIWEDGTGRSADSFIRSESAPRVVVEPEVTFFRSGGADHWFIGYITQFPSSSPPQADLNYYLSTSTGYQYAYLDYAKENGVASIARPRASATSTQLLFSALRYIPDGAGFKRQVMTRFIDFTGARVPSSSTVELSATSGACAATDLACRPGDKSGLASWAAKGRLFYSGSGGSPVGSYSSALSCQ